MAILGGVNIVKQNGMKILPQEAASAWPIMDELVGARYQPIAYVGTQLVKGVNHFFLAEQTLITSEPERHIVLVTINAFEKNYSIVAIERII